MAFMLQRGRGVGAEMRRRFDQQLGRAVEALAAPPDEGSRRWARRA
jgi:hypothetical protein